MSNGEYEKGILRKRKEFVYEQWRKLLCIHVVGVDINTNQFKPEEVTSEKVRTIFDRGYQLAMLQTKASLKQQLFACRDPNQSDMIERLINQIEDRLETKKCHASYSVNHDNLLLEEVVKREKEFLLYAEADFTSWGADRQM